MDKHMLIKLKHKKLETACGFHQQCNVVTLLTLTFIAVTAKHVWVFAYFTSKSLKAILVYTYKKNHFVNKIKDSTQLTPRPVASE